MQQEQPQENRTQELQRIVGEKYPNRPGENWQPKWQSLQVPAHLSPVEIAGRASRPLADLTVIGPDEKEFKVGKTVIKSQVADIKVFFGSDMNAQQIGMCAEIIYNDYKWLTAAEFKYFVNRVYSGFYSDMKNLSPAILTQWLRLFSKEILDARELNKPKWKPPDKGVSDELWKEHMAPIIADLKANSLKDAESPTFPSLLEVLENLKNLQSNENESC